MKVKSVNGFYLGDPCYVLSDDIYHGIWGGKYNYEDGEITDNEGNTLFVVTSTAYGDGYYSSNIDCMFPVDAGVIGIVPLDHVNKIEENEISDFGYKVDNATEAELEDYDGTIVAVFKDNAGRIVNTIEIYTNDEEEEDDDEEEYWESDEDEGYQSEDDDEN